MTKHKNAENHATTISSQVERGLDRQNDKICIFYRFDNNSFFFSEYSSSFIKPDS